MSSEASCILEEKRSGKREKGERMQVKQKRKETEMQEEEEEEKKTTDCPRLRHSAQELVFSFRNTLSNT